MAAWQFAKALFIADRSRFHRFVSMQNHYNLIYREDEREMIPLCLDQGIGLIPWSPLGRGFLTGRVTRQSKGTTPRAEGDVYADEMYYREEDYDVLDALLEVSNERNLKPAQIALAWLYTVPGVVAPIIGASRVEQLEELAAAVEIELTAAEIERLESPYKPHPVLGHHQPTPREF
jgi:aryl-alcohol dehydrogenase (NADP+)